MDSAEEQSASKPLRIDFWLPWLLTGLLLAVCTSLAMLYQTARTEISLQQAQLELAELENRSIRQQLEAERLLTRHLLQNRPDAARKGERPAP